MSPQSTSSDHHTTSRTSLSLCQSHIVSVCHNVIPTSPSICQSHDSSVCYPTRDVIIPTIWPTVCLSSVMPILPSANPMVKMPTSIPVQNFLHEQNSGKIPFVRTPMESSVHHSDSPFVNSSPSAAYPSKIPCNYGENTTVNYLHENPVKSPTVSASYAQPVHSSCIMSVVAPICALYAQPVRSSCIPSDIAPVRASSIRPIHTSCVMSVFAPIHASPVPSVLPYDDEIQEFPDGFPSTNYGEKNLSETMVKFPHNVTLTLQQAKFLEETPDTNKRVKYLGNFMLTQIRVKLTVINLRSYMLGGFHVTSRTMRCAHGSINKILMEWDPGRTYDVQRLWDPGGSTYSSRSSVPTNLDKLSEPKSFLHYIHLPGLSSLPFLVDIKPNLASSNYLEKLDHMGSFRHLPRLAQQA